MEQAKDYIDYANNLEAQEAARQAAAAQAATASSNIAIYETPTYNNSDGGGGGGGIDYSVGSIVGYNGWYYYDSWGASPAGNYWSGESGAVYIDGYTDTDYKGDFGIHISSVDGD